MRRIERGAWIDARERSRKPAAAPGGVNVHSLAEMVFQEGKRILIDGDDEFFRCFGAEKSKFSARVQPASNQRLKIASHEMAGDRSANDQAFALADQFRQ